MGNGAMGFLKRGKGEREKGKGERIITNAPCPMPHALCPMPHFSENAYFKATLTGAT
ncbi:hypothetical protein [[Scytonema hofmanni] UTEX B 1581]|uniref:hypothetical protein n=1 Tax=[Scytonema hofmanni] UTEX B 1581 TaxID=379535 RepID=UPI0004B09AE1|nr:hypothetical protein [[Scytonema hofmanni] UTEX B 1581]